MPEFDHLEAAKTLATVEILETDMLLTTAARFATAHALIDIAASLRTIAAKPPLVVNTGGDPGAVAEGIRTALGQCTSDVTLRDEEHRLIRCWLPAGHEGDHTDHHGVTWTGGER